MTEKSYKNLKFLNSKHARSIRILCEYEEPKNRFKNSQVENTIVFFGSARAISKSDAKKKLDAAKLIDDKNSRKLEIKKAKRLVKLSKYYDMTDQLANKITAWVREENKNYHIVTGAGPGIMEAANRGAFRADEKRSVGLGISLPFESELNPYISEDLDFEFHYFFTRKYWFLYFCKALIVCPGGFGTMDELFEFLTLRQTGKIQKEIPTVLLGKKFWDDFLNFEALIDYGVISEKDLDMFIITDSVGEAYQFLKKNLDKEI
jgi:uncharacterized protein (TIGR00730 family)